MKPGDILTKDENGRLVTRKILRVWKYEVEYMESAEGTRGRRIRTCTDQEWARWAKGAL